MSNEWLTTGQVIDRLKVGEKAETVEFPPICINMKNDYVTYNGSCFVWSNGDQLMINDLTKYIKWNILPNYVSFEEAMKAVREGKAVYLHAKDGEVVARLKKEFFLSFGNWQLGEFLEGNWTIEADTQ
jgi:hypothetical protein